MSRLKLILVRALAALCLASPAPALFAQETWAADFFEKIEVRTMNVEVFVTDRQGNAVAGLGIDDFEVLDDGQRMKLTNFYSNFSASEGGTGFDPAAAAAAEEQRLTVVLLFDQAHLTRRNRDLVVEQLRNAPWFKPEHRDRVMVISQRRNQSLEVIQDLADDLAKFHAALDRVAALPAAGDQLRLETQAALRQALDVNANSGLGAAEPREEVLASLRPVLEAEHLRIRNTLQTLEGFVDALTALPGRKALLYISDGLPARPGEALVEALLTPQPDSDFADLDTTALWRQLGHRANANRVTFYPLLAGGGKTDDFSVLLTGRNFRAEDRSRTVRAAAVQRNSLRTPMEILAESTGGLAFLQPKTFERAMAHLRQDFTSYYSLGYQAPRLPDGRDHRIEVRLKQPRRDLVLRHRKGYRDKVPEDAMADRTLSALFFGPQDDNPLGVKLEVGPSEKTNSEEIHLTVHVKIPISRLLLLPEDTFHEAQISIFVGARDAEGHTWPIQRLPAPIRIPNDRLLTSLNQMATYPVDLQMHNRSKHTVVVGVRDEIAARESTLRVAVRPGT